MPRQANASSRGTQKWQVAGSRSSEAASVNRTCAEVQSEDEHSASTRIPSSGGASPSASSTELGRQAPYAAGDAANADAPRPPRRKTPEEIQKEKEDRARWADVESDGEEHIVFDGEYKNAGRAEADGWSSAGKKKAKNGKVRQMQPDPPPAPPKREEPKNQAYRPPRPESRPEPRHNAMLEARHAAESARWEQSSWGSTAKSHASWGRSSGGYAADEWDESGWGQEKAYSKDQYSRKADFRGGGGDGGGGGGRRGGKEKNESFKRGPQVTTNMDSSRLAW